MPICVYVASFARSWGPLEWVILSETFPLETRTAWFSFAVSSNMLFTFLTAHGVPVHDMHLARLHLLLRGVDRGDGTFVLVLLPETKGVPIDEMVESLVLEEVLR